jgi:hypothetical protein
LHALLTIFLRIAAQQSVLFVMEDLPWVAPSTVALQNYGSFDLFTRDLITTDEIKHYVSKTPMR